MNVSLNNGNNFCFKFGCLEGLSVWCLDFLDMNLYFEIDLG